jgi:Zn-dependent protease
MKALEFRMSGIPVRVEPIFFLVMGLLAWLNGYTGALIPVFMLVAGGSILVHELGHATAHRSFGARPRVTLTGFGGVTTGPVHPKGKSLVVTLAGPGAGFLAAAVGVALSQVVTSDAGMVADALRILIWVNVIWGIFNLLPILPLDGGHVASDLFGARPALMLSVAGSAVLGLLGLYTGQVFLAFIGFMFGSQAYQALRSEKDQPQLEQLDAVRSAILRGEHRPAAEQAERIGSTAGSWPVEVTAAELAAWARLAEGEPEEAQVALGRLRAGAAQTTPLVRRMVALAQGSEAEPIAPAFAQCDDIVGATVGARVVASAGLLDRVLDELAALAPAPGGTRSNGYRALQLGLHRAGLYRESARVGDVLFSQGEEPLVAYNVACSWALAGDQTAALTWLDRAVDKGFRDTALLDQDANFNGIRDSDGFRAVRAWMESGPPEADPEQAAGA